MSQKLKLHSLHFLFQIFSYLADKSGGWKLFVKPKLIIGSLLLSITAYAQNLPQTKQNDQKQTIEHKTDSIYIDEETIFCYVTEQMPIYPGGEKKLMKFISENLKYPESAIKNKIQGRVIVHFIITELGTIEHVEVVRSVSTDCDKEAIRVVKKMPKWIPGKQNGKLTRVWYTIPINFKLK